MGKVRLPQDLQDWVEARPRFHLSHAQVQMARDLGMNPKKLGRLDNHDPEPWKDPLPRFIERIYSKSFGRDRPEVVISIEDRARAVAARKAARKASRQLRREMSQSSADGSLGVNASLATLDANGKALRP
jgi:hypothetical protein